MESLKRLVPLKSLVFLGNRKFVIVIELWRWEREYYLARNTIAEFEPKCLKTTNALPNGTRGHTSLTEASVWPRSSEDVREEFVLGFPCPSRILLVSGHTAPTISRNSHCDPVSIVS